MADDRYRTVVRATDSAIGAYYRANCSGWELTVSGSQRIYRRALERRLPPPSAWNDLTIDDPSAGPDWSQYRFEVRIMEVLASRRRRDRVDTWPVQAHLGELVEYWSMETICAMSGVVSSWVEPVYRGDVEQMKLSDALAVLAVWPAEDTASTVPGLLARQLRGESG